jgi:hypothetical protein
VAILKVFARKTEREAVLERARLIEAYEAFVVIDASAPLARSLARTVPLEDITAQYRLPIGGVSVDPLKAKATRAGRGAPLGQGPHHYVVQFIGPIKPAWLAALRRSGATVRFPFAGFAYVIAAREAALAKVGALSCLRWVGHLAHADRVAPGLVDGKAAAATMLPRRRVMPEVLTVEVFGAELLGPVRAAARRLGFKVLQADARARLLTLDGAGLSGKVSGRIRDLSKVHGVRFIRERVLARTSNDVATGLMGNTHVALEPEGLGLSGAGETVAVCDTGLDSGDASSIHPDFAGRVVALKSYPIADDWSQYVSNPGGDDGAADLDSGHGTHVAGSVLGDGAASAADPVRIRGHAHRARLVFQAIEQEMKWKPTAPASLRRARYLLAGLPSDLGPLFRFAYEHGARVHSDSWGGGDAGAYDQQAAQFDDFVWTHKDFTFVIAAGNDGTDRDGDGTVNPSSVTSPGTAKNAITVGASESRRPEFNTQTYGGWWPNDFSASPIQKDPMADRPEQVVAFSSRGPTADGRFKPDVVAPGTFILSTRSRHIAPNNFAWAAYPLNAHYCHMGGTSMATPLTAGAVALLREFLRTRRSLPSPSAALVKALLIAGARRLSGAGGGAGANAGTEADGVEVDSEQGFGRVDLDRSLGGVLLTEEGEGLQTGRLSSRTLKVSRAGKTLRVVLAYSDFPGASLVNNLNLIVTEPSGVRHVGNQRPGGLLADATNNVELVEVSKAPKGTWTVEVVASNVARGPQDFALVAVAVA